MMMIHRMLLFVAIAVGSVSASLSDASDVLNQLDNYDKLYVSYENCAWAPYGDQGNNNNNNNQNNGNACGVQNNNNNNNYWYIGMTECLRAQVAYSLYGVKKGEQDKGCGKGTFINSFFTTSGLEYFVESMATAGVSFSETDDQAEISSDCQKVQNNNNGRRIAEQADVDYSANNQKVNEGVTSVGVGCSDKTFALKTYQGAYCDALSGATVTDAMSTFNKEIDQAKCILIYDASASAAAADEGNNNNNNQNNNNDGSALTVLQYSRACDVRMFPKQCPDPYGKLRAVAKEQSSSLARSSNPRKEMVKTVFSWLLMGFGIIFWLAAAWAWYRKRTMNNLQENGEKKKRGLFSRNNSKNASQSEKKKSSEKGEGFFARIRGKNANKSQEH